MPPAWTRLHVPGKPLGRHICHDERSRDFPAPRAVQVQSVTHKRNVGVYDQGELGSCTGNAMAGLLSTDPWPLTLGEQQAVALYSRATKLDRIRGVYPPTDTGSSGLAVAKAAVKLYGTAAKIGGFAHAFGIDHLLGALTLAPCIIGIDWLTGCDEPDRQGTISWTGSLRGGHEFEAFGIDAPAELVWCWNSWGPAWGLSGAFAIPFADLDRALRSRGDAVFLTKQGAP